MMAAEVSNQPYNFIGISDAFHPLSHHANNPQKLERLAKVQAWNTGEFAKFVKQAAGTARWRRHHARQLADPVRQQHERQQPAQPLSAADGDRRRRLGKLKGNQHLSYPDKTPIANVHLTLLDKIGVPMDKLGDSTQKFVEI